MAKQVLKVIFFFLQDIEDLSMASSVSGSNSTWSITLVLHRWARVLNVRVVMAYLLHMLGTMGSIMVLTFLPGHLSDYRLSTSQIGLVCGGKHLCLSS